MWYKNIAGRFFELAISHKARVWQTDRRTLRRTDGRTDRQNYDSQDRVRIDASRGKNGWPYAIEPLSCLSCLSVTLVYCCQTVGWIRMPLGMEVGLDPGHMVLDGDPAPPERCTAAPSPLFGHVYCDQTVAHLSYCGDSSWGLVFT